MITLGMIFPREGTYQTLISVFRGIRNQLLDHVKTKRDQESTLARIVLADDRLTVQVSKNILEDHYIVDSLFTKDGTSMAVTFPQPMRAIDLVSLLARISNEATGELIKSKGQLSYTNVEWKVNQLIIHREFVVSPQVEKSMKGTLLLIDGANLLSRGYFATAPFGMQRWRASNGLYTNGVYTMTRQILSLCKELSPTHMAIAWDTRKITFRKLYYPEYKAHRKPMDPELSEQFETSKQLFQRMGIPQLSLIGYEADDVIGCLSTIWANHVEGECFIASNDKDFYQLLNPKVTQITPTKNEKSQAITKEDFVEQYQLEPKQWIDFKALMGDSADNIPGVKGIGEKTALPLIQKYGSIEEIYANIDELKESKEFKKCYTKLLEGKNKAFMSKILATIKTDFQLLVRSIDELKINIDRQHMIQEFEKLGFHSILRDIKSGKYRAS